MRYLVTGGAGFIGSHISRSLLMNGDEVVIIDDLSSGLMKNIPIGAKFIKGDIRDRDIVRISLDGVDGVFHLAAFTSVPESIEKPKECFDINVGGMISLLDECCSSGVKRVVYSSTSAVYADSLDAVDEESRVAFLSPYAMSKLDGEHLLEIYRRDKRGPSWVVLRYFNVYGIGQDANSPYAAVIPRFIDMAKRGKSLTIYGDGCQSRDFVHVNDVVEANMLAMMSSVDSEVFNIGSGESITVNDLANIIRTMVDIGPLPDVIYLPPMLGDVMRSLASIDKAVSMLDWRPQKSLSEGIENIWENTNS